MSANSLVEACSRLSESGEDAKVKGARKVGGAGKKAGKRKGQRAYKHFFYDPLPPPFLSSVSSLFFMFALSKFSGSDYFGAWNRLRL